MSLHDLKDAHLQKALRNAPDSDVAPSDLVRKAVLDYADKAVKPNKQKQPTYWLLRFKNMVNQWRIPSWQLTGLGSLAASVLVLVMVWHENPDDPLHAEAPLAKTNEQAAASEKDGKNVAQADFAAATATENAANKKEATLITKEKLAKQQLPQQQAATESQTDNLAITENTVIASAPAQAAAPAATKAEIATETSAAASEQASGMAAPKESKKMTTAETAVEQTKAEQPQADQSQPTVAAARAAKPYPKEEINLAQLISKEGGKAMAEKDIAAGKLRILVLNKQAAQTDEVTGYSIVLIADEAPNVAAEAAAYNQTMRDWHKQSRK